MNDKNIPDKPASHGEILKRIWKHLDLGVIDREHPFHTPVFATISNDAPAPRIVVLRRFWRKNPRRLAFHTHSGSTKVSEIEANPRISWLFYHPSDRFQLRIAGTATIHRDDELADEQWNATALFSRRCYIGEAPSQFSDKPTSGLPDSLIDRKPTPEESETGRKNFVVISSTIDSIDCMELRFKGNRRSLFKWNDQGELETKWLTP